MFTELKIKRICNSFKAPDIEIPLLSAKVAKRPRLKPVLATAALALVIVGASVVGIKGNIFKGEQPLPPVDTDTPDTPDTPTPPDTDTPTPPEDDVKIIYADSAPSTNVSMSISAGELVVDGMLQRSMKENEGCKFAVYVVLSDNDILYQDYERKFYNENERIRLLSNVKIAFGNFVNSFYNIVNLLNNELWDGNNRTFNERGETLISAMKAYEEKYSTESDDIYFSKTELEIINKVLSFIGQKFNEGDKETFQGLLNSCYNISGDFYFRLKLYKCELLSPTISEIIKYFENRGVKLERVNEEALRRYKVDPLMVYEAVLSKEEIYSLEGTDYGVHIIGRGKTLPTVILL